MIFLLQTAEKLLLVKKSSGRTTIPEVVDEDLFDQQSRVRNTS